MLLVGVATADQESDLILFTSDDDGAILGLLECSSTNEKILENYPHIYYGKLRVSLQKQTRKNKRYRVDRIKRWCDGEMKKASFSNMALFKF